MSLKKNTMHELVEYIVSLFEKKRIISSSFHELYVYGFSQLIYTFISTTAFILIGLFFHRPIRNDCPNFFVLH